MSSSKNNVTKNRKITKRCIKTSKIKDRKKIFKELSFYNVPIDKSKTKKLITNVEILHELPFYDELKIAQIVRAF